MATRDPSRICDLETYTTAHGNAGSLTHWARPGIEPATSWFPVGFVSTVPQRELQHLAFPIGFSHLDQQSQTTTHSSLALRSAPELNDSLRNWTKVYPSPKTKIKKYASGCKESREVPQSNSGRKCGVIPRVAREGLGRQVQTGEPRLGNESLCGPVRHQTFLDVTETCF